MKFTLRQLEVFVAVAQQESVSRAAEGLSLSRWQRGIQKFAMKPSAAVS